MLKILQGILEIFLGTVIMLFGALLAIWGNNVLIGLIIIVIGIFIYCIAFKNNPRNVDKPSKMKMSGSKRASIVFLCLFSAFIFFIIGISSIEDPDSDSHSTANPETSSDAPTDTEQTTAPPAQLGEYTIAIKEYYLSEGYYDEELLVVVYSFTNNSNSNISFSDAIEDKLFQNGVELDLYIATNIPGLVEIKNSWKELKPGASYDIPRAYTLNFENPSTVDIELDTENGTGKTLKYTIELK